MSYQVWYTSDKGGSIMRSFSTETTFVPFITKLHREATIKNGAGEEIGEVLFDHSINRWNWYYIDPQPEPCEEVSQ